VERLGRGGMGEVYLAEDLRLHRPVASGLNYPNIAVIYDVGELPAGGSPLRYIAMEYVAGRTLAAVGRGEPPDLDSVLDIVRQIAEALEEAHAHGVVHRDVKPSTRDPARLSADRAILGTLAYMAPEQALGQAVDARADVFSLGVVLYELLAGQRPFAGTNAVRVLASWARAESSSAASSAPARRSGDRGGPGGAGGRPGGLRRAAAPGRGRALQPLLRRLRLRPARRAPLSRARGPGRPGARGRGLTLTAPGPSILSPASREPCNAYSSSTTTARPAS